MRYEAYQARVMKIVTFMRGVFSHMKLILIVLACVLVTLAVLTAVSGTVYHETDVPGTLYYGDAVSYSADSVMSRASVRYGAVNADGSVTEWGDAAPVYPGTYAVRAEARGLFGIPHTGDTHTFTILPRPLSVTAEGDGLVWGETPAPAASGLAEGDRLDTCALTQGDVTDTGADYTADPASVRIVNGQGEDVTHAYAVTCAARTVPFLPRRITVTVSDAEFAYSGTRFSFDGYELTDGSLADGETLTAVFDAALTLPGETVNTPALTVVNRDGEDVTVHYEITTVSGKLTVTKRPLTVTTGSADILYDGKIHTFDDFAVAEDTPLIPGHTLDGEWLTMQTVGEASNTPVLRVLDENGADVTQNYALFLDPGSVRIKPRPITVRYEDVTVEYDGREHSLLTFTVEPADALLPGDRVWRPFPTSRVEVGTSHYTELGSQDVRINNAEGKSVSDNYELTVIDGTLTVTPRRLVIRMDDGTYVYDGEQHGTASYTFLEGTSLLWGHALEIGATTAVTDVGTAENRPGKTMHVLQWNGDTGIYDYDATANYEIFVVPGTLTVTPRLITVKTAGGKWTYDGEVKTYESFNASHVEVTGGDGLAKGHSISAVPDKSLSIVDAGRYSNVPEKIVITNAYMEDVTANYDMTVEYGELVIEKCNISVGIKSVIKEYDGLPPTTELETLFYNLPKGHRFRSFAVEYPDWFMEQYEQVVKELAGHYTEVDVWKVATSDVSNYTVTPVAESIVVVDADGRDVSANFNFKCRDSSIAVLPRPVSLVTGSAEKRYDGTPLKDGSITTAPGSQSIVGGQTVIGDVTGTRIVPGSSPNIYKSDSIRILTEYGRDVTHNYVIKDVAAGTLTVLPAADITVFSASDSKRYDGKALKNSGWDYIVTDGALLPDWKLDVSVTGRQTKVGVSVNTLSCRVIGKKGGDYTDYCNITTVTGTLEVKPAVAVLVTTQSDTKLYDGKPLKNTGYEAKIVAGQWPSGHTMIVEITGSQTMPGSSPNTVSVTVRESVKVGGYTVYGRDVTSEFEIILEPGTLTVLDPLSHIDDDDSLFGHVTTNRNGRLYLRLRAYGDYTGRGWNAALPYTGTVSGGYNYDVFTALSLMRDGRVPLLEARFTDMTVPVLTPYFTLPDVSAPFSDSDTGFTGTLSDYTFAYYPFDPDTDWSALAGVPTQYAADEQEYRAFVKKNYVSVDDETRAFLTKQFVAPYGLTASDPDIVRKVAALIRASAAYNLKYNPALDAESNTVIAFLSDYREGVCRHYAASAALLFRTLGIPARYVEGFAVDCKAGQTADIRNPGHAWVEVYLDGIGWIPVEVTGSANPKPVTNVTLTPRFMYKEYDGKPLYSDGTLDRKGALADLLDAGYTYTARISGSRTEVGTAKSVIEEFRLYDPNGRDVTDSAEFLFTYETGTLQVTQALVKIFLYQLSRQYDGTPLTYTEDDWTILSAPDGVTVRVNPILSLTTAGQLTLSDINAAPARYVFVRLSRNGVDVTGSYTTVVTVPDYMDEAGYIPIEVKKRPIELRAASVTRVWDGNKLSAPTVSVTKGSLAPGDRLEAKAVGELLLPGETANVIDPSQVRIVNPYGEDVTSSYDITCVNGTLILLES